MTRKRDEQTAAERSYANVNRPKHPGPGRPLGATNKEKDWLSELGEGLSIDEMCGEKMLTPIEAAEILGVSPATVRRYMRLDLLPFERQCKGGLATSHSHGWRRIALSQVEKFKKDYASHLESPGHKNRLPVQPYQAKEPGKFSPPDEHSLLIDVLNADKEYQRRVKSKALVDKVVADSEALWANYEQRPDVKPMFKISTSPVQSRPFNAQELSMLEDAAALGEAGPTGILGGIKGNLLHLEVWRKKGVYRGPEPVDTSDINISDYEEINNVQI